MLSVTVAQLFVSNGSDGKSAITKSLNWTTLPWWLASKTPPTALGGKCPLKEVTWTPSRKTETSDFRTSSVTWIHRALRGGPCGQEPIWDSYQFNRPCWISPVWKHGLPLAPTLGKLKIKSLKHSLQEKNVRWLSAGLNCVQHCWIYYRKIGLPQFVFVFVSLINSRLQMLFILLKNLDFWNQCQKAFSQFGANTWKRKFSKMRSQ